MAVAITAVGQAVTPPRVLVSVTGLGIGDSITLYRIVDDVATPIRGGHSDGVTDPAFVRVDAELPFGVPVAYAAIVNDSDSVFDTSRYTFDVSTESWVGEGSTVVARVTTAGLFHDGAGSLQGTKTMGAGLDTVRFNDNSSLPDDISAAGPTLMMWALVPAGAAGTGWQAHIEVQNSSFVWQAAPETTMTKGTWALLMYTPPAGLLANCRAVGVQFSATGVSGSQAVYIDTIRQGISPIITASAVYTLDDGMPVVTDAISGLSASVMIYEWPEATFPRQSAVYSPGGRNVAVLGPVEQPHSTVTFRTVNADQRTALREVLANATNGIVQIRQPGGVEDIDSYQAVLNIQRQRATRRGSNLVRYWPVEVAEVDGWSPELEARGFTLQDIADAYLGLSLADLNADYTTLLAIAQEDWS